MMDFTLDSRNLETNMLAFSAKFEAALEMYGDTVSKKLESQAKQNRPWTDRTNRARLGLTGSYDLEADGLYIVLAHTVDYGVWLELAHEKRFAIVEPTVRLESAGVKRGLERFLEKVRL